MTTPRHPSPSDELRAELLSDLSTETGVGPGRPGAIPLQPSGPAPGRLPGAEPLPTLPTLPRGPGSGPALEVRLTPTRWSLLRLTDRGVKVGPVSVGLRRA